VEERKEVEEKYLAFVTNINYKYYDNPESGIQRNTQVELNKKEILRLMKVMAIFTPRQIRLIFMAASVLLLLVVACGSSDSGGDDGSASEDDGPIVSRSADSFDVDSFVDAGWKKSKEYSTETVPDASAIWYGFYQSQDVEIRFYASHSDAIGVGLDAANSVVDRVPNSNLKGQGLFPGDQRTGYSDFMVAGNTIILCQSLIEICEELVENIP
jgi:hypothetical protein